MKAHQSNAVLRADPGVVDDALELVERHQDRRVHEVLAHLPRLTT